MWPTVALLAVLRFLAALWPIWLYLLTHAVLVASVPQPWARAAGIAAPGVLLVVGWAVVLTRPTRTLPLLAAGVYGALVGLRVLGHAEALATRELVTAGLLTAASGGSLLALLRAGTGLQWSLRGASWLPAGRGTHGSAAWAPARDVEALVAQQGVIAGQRRPGRPASPLLRVPLTAHALTIAPSRSGKLTAALAPNLLAPDARSWPGPVVVIDPKGEAYCMAARRRRELGRAVVLLDPFRVVAKLGAEARLAHLEHAEPARFNPLDLVHEGPELVREVGVLLDALVPPPAGEADATADHFHRSARRVVAGFVAWVALREKGPERSLEAVRRLLVQDEPALEKLLAEMAESELGFGLPRDAATLLRTAEARERGSILSTTTNALDWLRYPELAGATAASDFDLADLARNTLDLFVVLPPGLLSEAHRWLRLWTVLPLEVAQRTRPAERILLLVDELAALGPIEPIRKAFGLAAGYGVSVWGFVQALHDLEASYGEKGAASMLANAELVQVFDVAPADARTAETVSRWLGDATVWAAGTSRGTAAPAGPRGLTRASGQDSRSLQEARRPLLTPDEVRRVGKDELLLFLRGHGAGRPIRCGKADYRNRPELRALADPNPYHERENAREGEGAR